MIDFLFLSILSDLFVDLSAGWFGTVFIVPTISRKSGKEKVRALTFHFLLGTICLMVAYLLRKVQNL